MKTLRLILAGLVLSAVLPLDVAAQFRVDDRAILPREMRPLAAMDFTPGPDPVMVAVGDGAILTLPGVGFLDVDAMYRDRFFDGIAIIDRDFGIISTTDGMLIAIDPQQRRLSGASGFPCDGKRIVRCGDVALALRNGYVIRFRHDGGTVRVDTISGTNGSITLLASATAQTAVAYDAAAGDLVTIDVQGARVRHRRALSATPLFLHALSDSVSVMLVQSGSTRPLRAVWHYTSTEQTLTGHDPAPTTTLMATIAPSARGGGAVVVQPSPRNGFKRQFLFAVGNRIDSLEHSVRTNDPTRVIQTGIALWSGNGSTKPTWHIAGDHMLHTIVDSLGVVSDVGANFVPRSRAVLSSKLHLGGTETLVTTAEVAGSTRPQTFVPHLVSSVDGGASWTMLPLPNGSSILAVNRYGHVLVANNGSIGLGTIYSTNPRPTLTPTGPIRGALMVDDTFLVCADRPYRSVDGGRTWDSTVPPAYVTGPAIRTSAATMVIGSPTAYIVTNDAGRTWKPVSIPIERFPESAVVDEHGTVYVSASTGTGMMIAGSDGSSTTIDAQGFVMSIGGELYVGTARSMRRYEPRTGTVSDESFRTGVYNELGPTAYLAVGRAAELSSSGRPALDGTDNLYVLHGGRCTSIRRLQSPTSVAEFDATLPTVHPNPAASSLTVPAGRVIIRAITGAVVYDGTSDVPRSIDVRSWAQGTYIAETTNGHHRSAIPVQILR